MDAIVPAAVVCVIAILIFRRYESAAAERRARFEALSRMAEKFATAPELLTFLQSEDARTLLRAQETTPDRAALRLIQGSILSFAGGGALLINASYVPRLDDINFVMKRLDMLQLGTTLVILGVALVTIALITHALARRWSLTSR